jgi:regulator of RNase E activity RraA
MSAASSTSTPAIGGSSTQFAVPEEILDGFRSVPPATIGHVRQAGFVDTQIRPIYRLTQIVVGRAVTLKLAPGDVAHTRDAIGVLSDGDVLVIDQAGDRRAACWGEMTSLAARARGVAGIIVDGCCTDVLEIEAMGVPTWSRGVAALVGRRLNHEGGVNVPVQCGGVVVHPGDVVVADINGIVVIPPEEAEAVYKAARAEEDRAPHQRQWLLAGGSLAEITGLTAAEIAAKGAERTATVPT